MDIIELKTLLSDMTVEQFQSLMGTLVGFCIVLFLLIFVICYLAKYLIDFIMFLFRKDKYKEPDYIRLKGFSLICRLRKQAENAPTEKAYFLYYNRLLGALLVLTELGIISRHASPKLFDVKGKYEE